MIGLIANASLICTDSFHGTVFSILFGKPFLLLNRILEHGSRFMDMSSRTRTLLEKFGLKERLPENQELSHEGICHTDMPPVYEALQRERIKALRFLCASFRLE